MTSTPNHNTKLHDAVTVSAQVSGRVVLDLTRVALEPTAFGILLEDLQRLRDDNGSTVSLVGPTAEVATSLGVTVLERRFDCYRTVGDAVAALS